MYFGTMDADNPISKNDEIKLDCNVTRYNFLKREQNRLQRKLVCTHMPGTSQNVYLNLTKSKFSSF